MHNRCLYDSRFFVEYFYSSDSVFQRKLKEDLKEAKERFVSALVVHELHQINLEREGKEVANLRSSVLNVDFKVVDVDFQIAINSAELRSKYRIPMADSVIAASAQISGCVLVSDDKHFQKIPNLKTRWIT